MGAAKTKLSIKLPQAQDDTGSVLEGDMLTLDVLGNDKGGNSTSIYSIDQGDLSSETSDDEWIDLLGGGRIKIVDDEIIFDTAGDFEGLAEGETTEVVFTYAMRLGNGAISQAEVRVEITGQNDAPTVTDVSGAAMEDGAPVEITLDGDDIDSDDDGTTLTYEMVPVTGPGAGEGSASIIGNKLTFDPGTDFQNLAAGQTQDVTITYKAIDAHGAESGTATVTVTVTGENDDAVVTGDIGAVYEDGVLTAGGTVGITDVDDGEAEIQAQTNVAGTYGTFSINAAGVWSYQLDNDAAIVQDLNTGDMPVDSFTVWSKDGSASATVDVTVNGENDSTNTDPVAAPDVIIATVSTDAVIPVEWLLANDTDADMDTLTVTSVSIVGLSTDWILDTTDLLTLGTFTVSTPGVGAAVDPLMLSYEVDDGNGGTATGTATIGLAAPSTAGNDSLDISGSVYDFSFLEGKEGGDTVHGGDSADTIFGGNSDGTDTGFVSNVLIGDVSNLGGGVVGDPVIVGSYTGSNDSMFGGDGVNNSLYGDNFGSVTLAVNQTFLGGADSLTGGDGAANMVLNNTLIGDSQAVFSDSTGSFTGGNDVLTGGAGVNFLSFPGFLLYFQTNTMVGDVSSIGDAVTTVAGGNDTLISGALAADTMTGDFFSGPTGMATGGMDTFVFGATNGADTITDFESGKDVINLFDTGLSFGDLDSDGSGTLDGADDHISITGGNTVIDLGDAAGGTAGLHTVTVTGVTGMDVNDFDFVML